MFNPALRDTNLWDRMDREFARMFPVRMARGAEDAAFSNWAPAVDVKEEQDKFVVTADIPGVDPKDIDVTFENGVLTIAGHRESEEKTEKAGYTRIERSSGSFSRKFSLPDTADSEAIQARGKNGVLEIVIPKREQVRPRKIEVK